MIWVGGGREGGEATAYVIFLVVVSCPPAHRRYPYNDAVWTTEFIFRIQLDTHWPSLQIWFLKAEALFQS